MSFVLSSGSVKKSTPSSGYYPGNAIPDMEFTDLEGNHRNLHDYKGIKVVVNFWATYDAQSRVNNVQLYNYLNNSGVNVEFVSVVYDQKRNVVKKTLMMDRLEKISQIYKIERDGRKSYWDSNKREKFRNYLIDENGVIIAMNVTPEDLKVIL